MGVWESGGIGRFSDTAIVDPRAIHTSTLGSASLPSASLTARFSGQALDSLESVNSTRPFVSGRYAQGQLKSSDRSKHSVHSTTVLGVRHAGKVVLGSDGQATLDKTVLKATARKVRRIHEGRVLAGFAGATADAFTLFERFEAKLQQHGGRLDRAAVELAKDWRTDRYLRQLEALLAVASADRMLLITGTGDVIEPDDDVLAIGSGAPYALAAARAMLRHAPALSAREIVEEGLRIAAEICIYTNDHLTIEEMDTVERGLEE